MNTLVTELTEVLWTSATRTVEHHQRSFEADTL